MANEPQQQDAQARFRVATFAIIERAGKYLLARRRDIGWWNLPGGGLEYGETVDEGMAREIMEEVGIAVTIERVVGIYSKPRKNEVVITFLCHLVSGADEPAPSDEDWYANVFWLERRKCLLLTHAGTLFSVFVPDVRAPQLRPLGPYVVGVLEATLHSEGSASQRSRDARPRRAQGCEDSKPKRARLHERHGRSHRLRRRLRRRPRPL